MLQTAVEPALHKTAHPLGKLAIDIPFEIPYPRPHAPAYRCQGRMKQTFVERRALLELDVPNPIQPPQRVRYRRERQPDPPRQPGGVRSLIWRNRAEHACVNCRQAELEQRILRDRLGSPMRGTEQTVQRWRCRSLDRHRNG